MTWSSSANLLNLSFLEQGRVFTMLLTRADGQNLAGTKLQFRHTADGVWFDVPNFPNASSNVYLYEFRCVCPHMRLNFTDSGSAPYALTMVCAAESTF